MPNVVYEIVQHDGGWAYKVNDVFSEQYRTAPNNLEDGRKDEIVAEAKRTLGLKPSVVFSKVPTGCTLVFLRLRSISRGGPGSHRGLLSLTRNAPFRWRTIGRPRRKFYAFAGRPVKGNRRCYL